MEKNQRKIQSYIKTGLSRSYYLHLFAGGVAFLGILMVYAVQLLARVNVTLESLPDPDLSAALTSDISAITILFFVSFLGFLCCTVFYMIVLGHRVGGAGIAIERYIQQLKAGNYDTKRSLRKNDELGNIMNELHELAEILKKK